jgi:hypothetical protein
VNIKVTILERVVKWLVGGDLFQFISDTVVAVNDSSISGEEKRAYVLKKAKEFFGDVVTVLANLAIEVAVIALRAKLEKENGAS